ncbi:MAG: DUF899 domain-containing protein [Gammaproteobacteria bacterium]|nr:DUF899 domain-containing protein [Gammaproteobacteria bacterium]
MNLHTLGTESSEYMAQREALWQAEVALKEQREAVAALRRALPLTTPVTTDYRFQACKVGDDTIDEIGLDGCFRDGNNTAIMMQFMYGKAQKNACPMCAMWTDGYSGVIAHINQRASFSVVVAGELESFRDFARSRGWNPQLQLLSAAGSTFKADLSMETPDGSQLPGVSVFVRKAGQIYHQSLLSHKLLNELRIKDYSALIC